MDGLGLGQNLPEINPLAAADLPHLERLLGGKKLLSASVDASSERAELRALDACLGVEGLPQSATGQAALVTGVNVPLEIGYHYGPKPDPAVAEIVRRSNIFSALRSRGKKVGLLNAYPRRYFDAIESGKRLYSSIPLSVTSAGLALRTEHDFFAGEALSVDFTGQGWRENLGYVDAPVLEEEEAGAHLGRLAQQYDFAFFEYWISDFLGHRQDMEEAVRTLERFDRVLGGFLQVWDDEEGLVLLTSDHGNLEDLSTRRHTRNPVPALIIGSPALRARFVNGLADLSDVAPAIERVILN